MPDIKILTEAELRSQISLDLAAIECIEQAFHALGGRMQGELHHAIERGHIGSSSSFPELGDVISGQASGRQNEHKITLCDLTGTGIQDTAIATLAYQQCLRHEAGTTFVT